MLLLTAALLPACEENAVQEIAGPTDGAAFVKFFHFAPGAPGVNFYANDTKVTAISSTLCAVLTDANREQCTSTGSERTVGVNYGGSGNGSNGWYSALEPGQYTLSGRIAAETDKNLPIATLQTSIAGGNSYSYYMSGIYDAATKTAESFIVEDVLPAHDPSVAYVRFVHAVSNANPMTLHGTHRTSTEQVTVGDQVAYASAGAFTSLPPGAYDLATRYAGATTNAISRVNVNFQPGRIYTITARGDATGTMAMDFTANR